MSVQRLLLFFANDYHDELPWIHVRVRVRGNVRSYLSLPIGLNVSILSCCRWPATLHLGSVARGRQHRCGCDQIR